MKVFRAKIFVFAVLLLLISAFSGTVAFEIASSDLSQFVLRQKTILPSPTPLVVPPAMVTIAAVGDLMCHDNNVKSAYDEQLKVYNFKKFFKEIAPYILNADMAVANLETSFAGDNYPYKGYPRFNSPNEYLYAIIDMGFDVLTNANNHTFDYGSKGIISTLNQLDKYNLPHTGVFMQDDRPAAYFEANGFKIAVLAYSFGSNRPQTKAFLNRLTVNGKLNSEQIKYDIDLAKANADIVLVSVHWGNEYATIQNMKITQFAHEIAELGADAILGHHPHAVQPVELYESSNKTIPIFYSLGNFFCNPSKESVTAEGLVGFITFEKINEQATFKEIDFLPTYTYRYNLGKKVMYQVLPLGKGLENHSDFAPVRTEMMRALGRTTQTIYSHPSMAKN